MESVEYKQLSDVEHVLLRPDTYVGDSKFISTTTFTYNVKRNEVKYEEVTCHNGILKLFDEIFTNAVDNIERKADVTRINVRISKTAIEVFNDGMNTIPIAKCKPPNDNIYTPELIFTRLRSGSNFDDTKKRTYGGRNGIGSKLAAIFSTYFRITVCNNGKLYEQEVFDNCSRIEPPTITTTDEEPFVKIAFIPDFERLKCKCIDEGTYKILCKRVHDCSHLGVQLTINDIKLPMHSWNSYIGSYPNFSRFDDPYLLYEDPKYRWKIALTTSKKGISTSTVNYVNTRNGGTHLDYIIDQVKDYINANVKPTIKQKTTKGKVKGKSNKPAEIKKSNYTRAQVASHMFVIASSIIVNPEFVDQAKTRLQTDTKEFAHACRIPDNHLKAFVSQTHIIDELEEKTKNKLINDNRRSAKQVEKYIKANKAGTKEGYKCTLFICEGLSAKTMCVSGMNIIGYDYYGVYPLRGKVLNTRKCSFTKYCENREIQDLIAIIGLEEGKEYTSTKGLNYGKIVCMKDADTDGADIMGLVMNFFEHKFSSLTKLDGFFNEFITPMIQVNDKGRTYDFYNPVQYEAFMNSANDSIKKASVRFIKGLASNTKNDIDKYFNNYKSFLIPILFDNNYTESLDKAFSEKRADDRKVWLSTITPETHLPRESGVPIHVDDFIDKELICYALDACARAIPSVIDGLKPVQRKILYTLFNDSSIHRSKEIKVFQLCGNVGKFANYHHGDASLNAAIIGMAQSYPGSNNYPLVENASDGFGTRQENGHDCGQPRYLTVKSKATRARYIFPQVDDNVLRYRKEDNEVVEPYYYIPIVPLVLINGAVGIGMGWSTTIPMHSIRDCIEYTRALINESPNRPVIHTFYNDYDGIITDVPGKYVHNGVFEIKGNTVRVTELPITKSISSFRDIVVKVLQLDEGESIDIVTDAGSKSTKTNTTAYHISDVKSNPSKSINHIDMELTFDRYPLGGMEEDIIKKLLKLTDTISTENLTAFDKTEHIKAYKDIYQMVADWYEVRKQCYVDRKDYLMRELEHKIKILRNRVKFVKENIEETLDYKNKSDIETDRILLEKGYEQDKNSFDYLLSMQVRSFTEKKYKALTRELEETLEELEDLKKTTIEQMWLNDLEQLENSL